MRGPESRAIIRQLVCGRYCYLMLMPLDPIDTRARDGTKNRFHAAATKRRRRPPPAGDARAPSPSRRGHGRRTPEWWCTKKLTLECYDPVYRPGPVPTCPPCTTAEPREGERSVGATRGKKSLYRATVSCYETLSRNFVVLRFFRSLEKL